MRLIREKFTSPLLLLNLILSLWLHQPRVLGLLPSQITLVWLMMSRLLMKVKRTIMIGWAMMTTRDIMTPLVRTLSKIEMSMVKALTSQWTLVMMRGILEKGLSQSVAESVLKVGTPELRNLVVSLLPTAMLLLHLLLMILALPKFQILIFKVLLALPVVSSGAMLLVVISNGVMLHNLWIMGQSFNRHQWGRYCYLTVVMKMLAHI